MNKYVVRQCVQTAYRQCTCRDIPKTTFSTGKLLTPFDRPFMESAQVHCFSARGLVNINLPCPLNC